MSQDHSCHAERRAGKRKRAHLCVTYRVKGHAATVERTAETSDISSVGAAFESEELLGIGTHIEMSLRVPGFHEPLKLDARVTRIEEISPNAVYLHGVRFDTVGDKARSMLDGYIQSADLNDLLRLAIQRNASDVHLVANRPPVLRIDGNIIPMDAPPLTPKELELMIHDMMTERQIETIATDPDIDFSYITPQGTRFRVNVHMEMGNLGAALRVISSNIRGISDLGLPPVVSDLAKRRQGLILVTGPAGSGKSTTLAAIIEAINNDRNCMIISIEDPIEYVHISKRSVIKQREVGSDTISFARALRHVLRQDPNVILIGELRDLDSISMAITAAETGHLVLSTVHTPNTVECIARLVDVYPAEQQAQVRSQLAECLQAVIGQILLPRYDGTGMVLATEVLINTPAIKNLIRNGRTEQILSYIGTGKQTGMHLMDESLYQLATKGVVDMDLAKAHARNPKKLFP